MSRNNKQRRKEKQQKQRRKKLVSGRTDAPRWLEVCHRAAGLCKQHLWREARSALENYDCDHPGQRQVLRMLLDIYHQQEDYRAYCHACRRLIDKTPDDRVLHPMLAAAYLNDARMASSLRAFRRFVELWPDDPMVEGARQSIAQLQPAVDKLLAKAPFAADEALELTAMHEEAMACLGHDCERAIRIGEQLLARSPGFVSGMNNLSQAYSEAGQADRAIDLARQVLVQEPDDFHALANLTRFLYLTGRREEAETAASQLRLVRSDRDEVWCKKCEALSLLGDDETVLAIFDEAVRAGAAQKQAPHDGLLYHLAAVASARLGDDRQAERYWRQALKLWPTLAVAKDNLADAAKPPGERHGPWPFSFNHWLDSKSAIHLAKLLDDALVHKNDEAATKAAKRFAEEHPAVTTLVPALLDRGGEVGRKFAQQFALVLDTPEMHDALRSFCQSQRGPDRVRMETAQCLGQAGILPSEPLRLWIGGHWRNIELLSFDVTREPMYRSHTPQVDELASLGLRAIRRDDPDEAERLFKRCIEIEGDAPDLLNNLAAAYSGQGRDDDATALLRTVHERWPDYFFGRIAMANLATTNGDIEQAEAYLEPLRRKKKLHITEFTALAIAYIQMLEASDRLDAAQSWLHLWRKLDPADPQLAAVESHLQRAKARSGWRKLFSK